MERWISQTSEIWVLINGTWTGECVRSISHRVERRSSHQAWDADGLLFVLTENVREAVGKGSSTLNTSKVNLANVGGVVEAENGTRLVERDVLR